MPSPQPIARTRLVPIAAGLCLALVAAANAAPARGNAAVVPPGAQLRTLAVNDIAMRLSNCGSFAADYPFDGISAGYGGLVFPTGSGKVIGYAGGLWITGQVAGSLRAAICEYGTEYQPGPGVPGGPGVDTLRYRVFSVARGDTAGQGAWMARAVPLGAPVDSAGTGPGLIGERTMWTVFTDAGVTQEIYGRGARVPIGLEVQFIAYAFDRPGVLRDVAFLHFRIVNRGTATLDSAAIGLWYDADTRTAPATPAASDTALDLEYVYHLGNDVLYGGDSPATGVALLRGPRDPDTDSELRPSSIVGYPNGVDPASSAQFDVALRGRYPWGDAMIDSTTLQPSRFFATGDPVTGSGWLMPAVVHPKIVMGLGPFRFAPGDTQVVDAAIVVGQGADALGSVVALRANVREARAAWAAGFAGLPAPVPQPGPPGGRLVAVPNPARGSAEFALAVPEGGAFVTINIVDVSGRRVRRIDAGWRWGGTAAIAWDGTTDEGRAARAGIYFARARVGGRRLDARLALIR